MDKRIIVTKDETVVQSWARDAGSFALFAALIGLGVVVGSSAMQWAGFVIAWIVLLTKASGVVSKSKFTIDEARKEIDRIEAEMK